MAKLLLVERLISDNCADLNYVKFSEKFGAKLFL